RRHGAWCGRWSSSTTRSSWAGIRRTCSVRSDRCRPQRSSAPSWSVSWPSTPTPVTRARAERRADRRTIDEPVDLGHAELIRDADARAAVGEPAPHRVDVVIADVFRGARVPAALTTVEFAGAVGRLLTAGGYYAINLTDVPGLMFTRAQVATLRAAFADVC